MDSNINSCSERIILMVSSVAEIFGIETITPEYYKLSLTHASFTKEKNLPYTQCYVRLEILGDAV